MGNALGRLRAIESHHLLTAFVLLQPLILLRFVADQFAVGKIFYLYLIVAMLLLAAAARKREALRLPRDRLSILAGAYLLAVLLSSLFALNKGYAFLGRYQRYEGWLTFVAFAVLFFAARYVERRHLRTLGTAVAFSSLAVSAYGLLQRAGVDFIDWGAMNFEAWRVFSTVGNPVQLGGFLAIAVPISAWVALSEGETRSRLLGFGAVIAGAVCLILTESQGAWLGAWFGALALALGFGARNRLFWLKGAAVALSVASVAGVGALVYLKHPSVYNQSVESRVQIYRISWKMALERPLFGWGADNVRLGFEQTKDAAAVRKAESDSLVDKAHSWPLEAAATTGLAGLAALIGFVGAVLATGYRRLASGFNELPFWFAGALGYIAYLMTGVSDLSGMPLLWIALGVLAGYPASAIEAPALKRPAVTAAAAAAAALTLVAFALIISDALFLQAERLPYREADASYRAAEQLNPFNYDYRVEHGPRLVIEGGEANDREAWRVGVDVLEETVRANPHEAEAYANLGFGYFYGGKDFGDMALYPKALDAFKRGLKISPYYPEAHWGLSSTYLAMGDSRTALRHADTALDLKPSEARFHLVKAEALADMERYAEAEAVLITAVGLDPGDEDIAVRLREIRARPQ
ncbi:MAG: O-antigen ligase family protein [Candidatus Aquicultorales bacterium]